MLGSEKRTTKASDIRAFWIVFGGARVPEALFVFAGAIS